QPEGELDRRGGDQRGAGEALPVGQQQVDARSHRGEGEEVVVRAADGEQQHERVQADEEGGPERIAPEGGRAAPDEPYRGQAPGGGEDLEAPERAGDPERYERVAREHEEGAVRLGQVGRPAAVDAHLVRGEGGRGGRGRVDPVERPVAGGVDGAEDVAREEGRGGEGEGGQAQGRGDG